MNVRQLRELINMLPESYNDRSVYYCTDFTFSEEGVKENYDPESLTDISEFGVDTEDLVIVLRGSL